MKKNKKTNLKADEATILIEEPIEQVDLIESIINRLPFEIIKGQIEAGADINQRSGNGMSALQWAAYYMDNQLVEYLLSLGAKE
jgi:protein arginine N-methyltransferase 2